MGSKNKNCGWNENECLIDIAITAQMCNLQRLASDWRTLSKVLHCKNYLQSYSISFSETGTPGILYVKITEKK